MVARIGDLFICFLIVYFFRIYKRETIIMLHTRASWRRARCNIHLFVHARAQRLKYAEDNPVIFRSPFHHSDVSAIPHVLMTSSRKWINLAVSTT